MSRQRAKREQHYQFLVNIMRTGKVDSVDKVQAHIHGMKKKATRFSIVVVLLAILLFLIMPSLLGMWFMLSFGAIAWAWASTLSGFAAWAFTSRIGLIGWDFNAQFAGRLPDFML